MTFRGRLLPRLLAVLITVAGLVAVGAPPASAGHFRTLQYVALGDSYAAGQGGGNYLNDCKQTAGAYPKLLDSRKHIYLRANASCSGARTSDVLAQVSALNRRTRLVTLTVGANDLGVASVAAACTAVPPTDCEAAIANASRLLSELAGSLPNVYNAIAAAAPRAEILVTGYPYLFEDPPSGSPAAAINYATTLLNKTIKDTVAAMPKRVNIRYVDVTAAFAGHAIGGDLELFINDSGPDAFHPNVAGYGAYAAVLIAALSRNPHK